MFKSDYIKIGNGCSVGVDAFVHYGVTMGDRVVLDPDSFLMKGETLEAEPIGAATPPRRCATPRRLLPPSRRRRNRWPRSRS